MGVRDHDPAVDYLRLGRRVTIVGGALAVVAGLLKFHR